MDELFSQFGLDTRETKAFLELLRLGAQPVSVWAKHAGIKRPTMYVYLDRFTKLGLVTSFDNHSIRYVSAVPISTLESILEKRKEQVGKTAALLKHYMPDLSRLQKTSVIIPKVRFYEGVYQVSCAYDEVLKEKSFKAIFNPERVYVQMPKYYYLIPDTLKKRKGKAKELLVSCSAAEEYKKRYNNALHQIKILPKTIAFSADTIYTDEKIYLIGYGERDIVATEIWNRELAETQSKVFDLLWESVPAR